MIFSHPTENNIEIKLIDCSKNHPELGPDQAQVGRECNPLGTQFFPIFFFA